MQRNALRAKPLMWLLVVPALGWGLSVRAQGPAAQLHVATTTGATTFHIGERISLQLLDLLKAKLSQYPRGTAFALIQPDSSADMQRFEKQVRGVFDDAGMKLTKKP